MPAPLEQQLHDLAVRHRIGLGAYSNRLVREVIALLNKADADLVAQLANSDITDGSRAALDALLVSVRARLAEAYRAADGRLTDRLDELAGAEAEFQQKLLDLGAGRLSLPIQSGILPVDQVVTAALARPFMGRFLKDWLAGLEDAAQRRVQEAVQLGWTEHQTIDKMVQRLRGTRAAGFSDGVLDINRRGAEAVVRTAVAHYSSTAAQVLYEQNADIIEGVWWISTLDSHTTLICIGLDGQKFPLNSGPRPPAHILCRSIVVPLLKGMKPFPRTEYLTWLKGQSTDVQDEILGPTRARLWRSGGLSVRRFTDDKQRVLTLDELRARDARAFAKAGL